MGAGTFPAGFGPAGLDPVQPALILPKVETPIALRFDLATRTFPRNPDGSYQSVHWVNQAVALALGIAVGAIGSVPSAGHRLRRLRRGTLEQVQHEATDFVRLALADLMKRSDIELLGVDVQQPARGQTLVSVAYVNLRIASPSSLPTTLQAAL